MKKVVDLMLSTFQPRRPYLDDNPEGYMESDRDFIKNNHDLCIAFLETLEAVI